MTKIIVLLFPVIWLKLSSSTEIPTYKCLDLEPRFCYLRDINLTKKQPNFNIEIDNPDIVTHVFVQQSFIPLLSNSICKVFKNLESIQIKRAFIDEIAEDAFENCLNLDFVDLDENHLKELPETLFSNSTKLMFLFLSGNFLQSVPDNLLSNSEYLNILDLSKNKIQKLSLTSLETNERLEYLLIYSNDLLTFDGEKLLKKFPYLQGVAFNDNLLPCEQHLKLVEFFTENEIESYDLADGRQRFVRVQKVGDVFCVADVDWTGLFYKREVEQSDLEELRNSLDELKGQVEEKLNLIRNLSATLL